MKDREGLTEFYHRISKPAEILQDYHGHVNVFSREACALISPYTRRDFYKVSLIIGTGTLHYASRYIKIDRPALLFSNPLVPYSWEAESHIQKGWFCLFTDSFLYHGEQNTTLQESPLYKIGASPIYFLEEEYLKEASDIFEKMQSEISSAYVYKYDVLRNYLQLIFHLAMKMNPAESFAKNKNASSRITSLFMELLERQFPIDTPERILSIKSANDFAFHLSVHVNHLNRAVKEVTGKTTTHLIAARIVREAVALLENSDWTIGEIASGLGFSEAAYFSNFMKKNTGKSPLEFRTKV